MALQWVGASLLDGHVIGDLPGLEPQWPLRRTVSTAEAGTFALNLERAPENWRDAILYGGSIVACYDDADTDPNGGPGPIQWAGYVTVYTAGAASNQVQVSAATYESVLDRAFVGDRTYYSTQHRDDVIADLVTNVLIPNMGGITVATRYTPGGGPLLTVMDSPPVPNAAIVMQNADNATVKNRIEQVFAQYGGEYTVEWSWTNSGQAVLPTIVWGDRVGTAAVAGRDPSVTFELPGSLLDLQQTFDYSIGAGANKIVAYSSGQGSSAPFSIPVYADRAGRPILEERYQPAPSISPTALAGYAQQAIKVRGPGARPIALTAALGKSAGRQLGTDWFLGDDIGYRVPSSYTNETGATVQILAFPDGLEGVGRAIGYELTDSTITPILADATLYQGA